MNNLRLSIRFSTAATFAITMLVAAALLVFADQPAPNSKTQLVFAQAQTNTEETIECLDSSNMQGPLHGRTKKVALQILSHISGYDENNCGEVTTAQLNAVSGDAGGRLRLNNKGLTSLKSGDFADLTNSNLQRIYLNNNQLTSLPEDIFDSTPPGTPDGDRRRLTNLRTINLSKNWLTELPPNLLKGLTGLRLLDIAHNPLQTLPAELIDGLLWLNWLYISHTLLTELPADIFSKDRDLRELDDIFMEYNHFPEGYISVDTFGGKVAHNGNFIFDGFTRSVRHPVTNQVQKDFDTLRIDRIALSEADRADNGELATVLHNNAQLNGDTGRFRPIDRPTTAGTSSCTGSPVDGRSAIVVEVLVEQIDNPPAFGAPPKHCSHIGTRDDVGVDQMSPLADFTVLSINRANRADETRPVRPLRSGDFAGMTNLRALDLTDNGFTELPDNIFDDLQNLAFLYLHNNDFNPPLSDDRYASLFDNLPSLQYISFDDGEGDEQVIRSRIRESNEDLTVLIDGNMPTQTPPPTPPPSGNITRIEPGIESIKIVAGDKVRLSIKVFGAQNARDDSLADGADVTVEWSSDGGGSFEEAAPAGVDSNGQPDDRKVLHTVSDTPGTYTVTAQLGNAECSGTEDADCRAQFEIIVIRSTAVEPSPTPMPCNISGTIPSAIADSQGEQYSVFTPADGGSFASEDGGEITAPINAVSGCAYIGIRIDKAGPAANANNPLYRYTLAGDIYSVSAVDSAGTEISDYSFDRPVQMCVPLPVNLRGNTSEISLLIINQDRSLSSLTSKLKILNGNPRVCGALSQLPVEVAAGKRGAPEATPPPMPTATPETPETGGTALPHSWAWLIAILGIGIIALGIATLARRGPGPSLRA